MSQQKGEHRADWQMEWWQQERCLGSFSYKEHLSRGFKDERYIFQVGKEASVLIDFIVNLGCPLKQVFSKDNTHGTENLFRCRFWAISLGWGSNSWTTLRARSFYLSDCCGWRLSKVIKCNCSWKFRAQRWTRPRHSLSSWALGSENKERKQSPTSFQFDLESSSKPELMITFFSLTSILCL